MKVKHVDGLQAELNAKLDDSQLKADGSANWTADDEAPSSKAVDSRIDSKIGALPDPMVYRGALAGGSDITGSATGNTYVDGAAGYNAGDVFRVTESGDITVSDGVISVGPNDKLVINKDVADKANVVVADVDHFDSETEFTQAIQSFAGTTRAADTNHTLTLANTPSAGFELSVTTEGLKLPKLSSTPGVGDFGYYYSGTGNDVIIRTYFEIATTDSLQVEYEY